MKPAPIQSRHAQHPRRPLPDLPNWHIRLPGLLGGVHLAALPASSFPVGTPVVDPKVAIW